MAWCSHCGCSKPSYLDGKICCSDCGRLIGEDMFSEEATFVKNAAGQSTLSGNYVRTIQNEYSVSRRNTENEAKDMIHDVITALGIDDSMANPAFAFYSIALERNFTRGRWKKLVVSACLYIACRESGKPFLLIDFSEQLAVNVYMLGGVFLQLCKLLSLEEHPIVQKPVDPSIFMHRFTEKLFGGEKNQQVTRTATLIVASMKRDWMQTGRKPSGLCGAALYISALSYGHIFPKSEIIKVVHVCEATLTRRLIEFENTESGGLTIEEFNVRAKELEKEERSMKASGGELLCKHKDSGKPPFAHGLCEECYTDFIELSGGLDGGSEPPAFQRAEMERIIAREAGVSSILPSTSGKESNKQRIANNGCEYNDSQPGESFLKGDTLQDKNFSDACEDKFHEADDTLEESETLSDIDDKEVDDYLLHNEEEKKLKKIIWEEMNKEYLQELAAKEATAAAAKKAYEARFADCSEEDKEAFKLAAEAEEALKKSKKESQKKRAAERKNLGPAKNAAEATKQMLDRKRLSSKINYEELEKLFDESEIPISTKKSRVEAKSDDEDNYLNDNMENEYPEIERDPDFYYENTEGYDYGDEDIQFDDF